MIEGCVSNCPIIVLSKCRYRYIAKFLLLTDIGAAVVNIITVAFVMAQAHPVLTFLCRS